MNEHERPITRQQFLDELRAAILAFEALPNSGAYSQERRQSFPEWFAELEADVFAPSGP